MIRNRNLENIYNRIKKSMRHLAISLTRRAKDGSTENDKTLPRAVKGLTSMEKPGLGSGDSAFLRCPSPPTVIDGFHATPVRASAGCLGLRGHADSGVKVGIERAQDPQTSSGKEHQVEDVRPPTSGGCGLGVK